LSKLIAFLGNNVLIKHVK